MKIKSIINKVIVLFLVCGLPLHCTSQGKFKAQTLVEIQGEKWIINGEPTLKGKTWRGYNVEGLLPNSRMVQGIFDDLNPETRDKWKYPDTGKWDADRNTNEFLAAMDDWHSHGLLAFTINLQGGSPFGYSKGQPWINSAIDENGELRKDYMNRLAKIIDKSDKLGMVVILGIFYFGQDERIKDEAAVIKSVDNTVAWVLDRGYRNVIIEVANECDNKAYDHEIIGPARITELIAKVKQQERDGYRLLVSTSFNGGSIPNDPVIEASDFVLIHGNGVHQPAGLNNMANIIRNKTVYSPKPIVNNEDDHFDFEKPMNNFVASTSSYVSWGYFDYRKADEPFEVGYQSVPVDWGITSDRKKGFFNLVKEMTGGN
ncbi:MAG: hypothetical protein ACFCUU_05475 [Cyclobacteriaceae bacterium]